MIKKTVQLIVLMHVCFVVGLLSYADEMPWKMAYKKNGVEVFTRPSPGSDLDEFLGIIEITTTLDMIEKIFDNVEGWSDWMANCKESRFIRKIDERTKLVYTVTKTPWPVSNRDSVCVSKKEKEPETGNLVYVFHAVEDSSIPVGKGNVRVKELYGKWTVTRLSPDRIKISYAVKCNPGGSIPKYLANMSSRETPYETLIRLKDAAALK